MSQFSPNHHAPTISVCINGVAFQMYILWNDGFFSHVSLSQQGEHKAHGFGSNITQALAQAFNQFLTKKNHTS